MKKTIVIITLALLAVVSIFADTLPANKTTTVLLELKQKPTYVFAITNGAFTSESIQTTDPSTTTMDHTNEITLSRNTTNVLNVDSVSTYYFSYFFYEYEGITITLSIDGNLKNQTTYAEDDKDANEIPYNLTVASGNDNTEDSNITSEHTWSDNTVINSTATEADNRKFSVQYSATTKLGVYRWASLQLTIAPQVTTDTLKGKVKGTYKSTITLAVTAS